MRKPRHEFNNWAQTRDSCRDSASPTTVDGLLVRISENDREAAAEFLSRYGARLRRRIHGKLGVPMRRIFDSQDIMSTVARRLDRLVMSGHLRVENEQKLWSLLLLMIDHAIIDKARHVTRTQTAERVYANGRLTRDNVDTARTVTEPKLDVKVCLKALDRNQDRRILSELLTSQSLRDVAVRTLLSLDAVRRRWGALRKRLRRRFDAREIARKDSRRS